MENNLDDKNNLIIGSNLKVANDVPMEAPDDIPTNCIKSSVDEEKEIELTIKCINDIKIESDHKSINDIKIESDHKSINDIKIESDHKCINDLSDELLIYLFNQFELIDVIKLRLVSKKWSILIKNNVKFNKLNLIDAENVFYKNSNSFCLDERLHSNTNCSIYYYDSFPLPDHFLNSTLFKSLFSNLKYLNLEIELDEHNLEILNQFQEINHLEIASYCPIIRHSNLKLNNLITFCIYNQCSKKLFLNIRESKIKNFLCDKNLKMIKFENIESIENLRIDGLIDDLNILLMFKNLRTLCCFLNCEIQLEILPIKLRKLNFIFNFSETGSLIVSKLFEHYRNHFNNLLDKRIELNRFGLCITIQGIKLLNKEQFSNLDFELKNTFLQVDNYLLLIKSPTTKCLYIDLDESNYIFTKLSDNFFLTKLYNIQKVVISNLNKIHQNNLIDLLNKFKNLINLILKDVSFDQEFYDLLPNICYFLNFLYIESCLKGIDFDQLIFKFKYLIRLKINFNLDLRYALLFFKLNQYLLFAKFLNQHKECEIKKINNYQFKLKLNFEKFTNLTFEELRSKVFEYLFRNRINNSINKFISESNKN